MDMLTNFLSLIEISFTLPSKVRVHSRRAKFSHLFQILKMQNMVISCLCRCLYFTRAFSHELIVSLLYENKMKILQVCISDRHRPRKKQKKNKSGKGKDWIVRKKEQMRRRGNVVPPNTKYTGRKRKDRF